MRLIPSRPVTIDRADSVERWFPFAFTHTDGSFLLYVQYGHDLAFSPTLRLRSQDDGKSWQRLSDDVPRAAWSHSFSDGELFEIDFYGAAVANTANESLYYGAWSKPSVVGDNPRRDWVRVRSKHLGTLPLRPWINGNPTMPWWPLWKHTFGLEKIDFDRITLRGPIFTTGVSLGGDRLLSLGYFALRQSSRLDNDGRYITVALESKDRGRTWDEVGLLTDPSEPTTDTNEATMVRLKDGRLLAILRHVNGPLVQTWSNDEGRTWTKTQPLRLIDDDQHKPAHVWPCLKMLGDRTLVLAYGRPGKHVIVDPSGTGTQWQSRLDLHAWELETQAINGVPEHLRLRGVVGQSLDESLNRYHDSGDYLGIFPQGAESFLVTYDVHDFLNDWNSTPISGVRMVRVQIV